MNMSGRYDREDPTGTLMRNFKHLCRAVLRKDVHKARTSGAKTKKNG